MKASEARALAREKNTACNSKALASAMAAIKQAAKKGEYSVYFYVRLPADAKTKLRADGYKLREWDEQRDGYGCEITW